MHGIRSGKKAHNGTEQARTGLLQARDAVVYRARRTDGAGIDAADFGNSVARLSGRRRRTE
jgi:hypothetical protein